MRLSTVGNCCEASPHYPSPGLPVQCAPTKMVIISPTLSYNVLKMLLYQLTLQSGMSADLHVSCISDGHVHGMVYILLCAPLNPYDFQGGLDRL